MNLATSEAHCAGTGQGTKSVITDWPKVTCLQAISDQRDLTILVETERHDFC